MNAGAIIGGTRTRPYDGRHMQAGRCLRKLGAFARFVHLASARTQRRHMATHPPASPDHIPLGQRLFDNVFLLLAAGLVIMFLFYTGWGLWEILSLPAGALP
jgi:hypothetical protein